MANDMKDVTKVTAKAIRAYTFGLLVQGAEQAVAERDSARKALRIAVATNDDDYDPVAEYAAWVEACDTALVATAALDAANAKILAHDEKIAANRAKRAEAEANGTSVPAELSEDSDDDDENFETANA